MNSMSNAELGGDIAAEVLPHAKARRKQSPGLSPELWEVGLFSD
jgi:hypothetical protein